MACPNFVIWRPIPDGCTIKAQSSGDATAYNAVVAIIRNGASELPMRHNDLDPGPAERPIGAGDTYILDPSIDVFKDLDEPAVLELWIEDDNGDDLMVSDGAGGKRPARCSWSLSKVNLSPLFIEVLAFGADV